MPPAADDGTSSARRAVARRGALALVSAVLWIQLLDFPLQADMGFDMSWRLVLHWATSNHLAFGREFVFTYGPLGHLLTRAYAGGTLWDFLGFHAAVAALAVGVGLVAAQRLGRVRGVLLIAFLGSLVSGETLHVTLLLAIAGLAVPSGIIAPWQAAGTALVCAVLGLTKPTTAALCAFLLAGIVSSTLAAGRGRLAAGTAGAAVLAAGGLWSLAGQKLSDLPGYLATTAMVSRANLESMALEEPWTVLALGTGAFALSAIGAACALAAAPGRVATWAAVATAGGFAFVKWKHGFVRADLHVNHFFLFAIALSLLHPLLVGVTGGPLRRAQRLAFALAGLAALLGAIESVPGGASTWGRSIASRTTRNLRQVANLSGLREACQAGWDAVSAGHLLPLSWAVIGDAPVDVVGPAQGLVFPNRLTYRPRPVFQSWSAYSGELNRINETFFTSARRPVYVLQQLVTIDRRLPTQDDARVLALLLRDYEVVHDEEDQLLWRDRAPGGQRPQLEFRLAREESARFGEPVALGDLSGQRLWVQLDYRPAPIGRIRRLFYKLPRVGLRVEDTDGRSEEFRLLRLVAHDGFILSPLLRDHPEWKRHLLDGVTRRPAHFTVALGAGDRNCFEPQIGIRISTLDPGDPR